MSMTEPDGPDLIAATDQALESLKQVTRMMWTYFRDLQAEGFSKEEAFRLTLGHQTEYLGFLYKRPEA